ncbi:hypothetical protein, partial [Aeromonas veronii]|uniref:hypothetical protein n=1 Tax=Aeromonas veronii TaxID=654 RepID=UPI003D25B51B
MTKHDWEEHKKRYLEEYPELTLAAYAALFGLNPSTTRRAMRGANSTSKCNSRLKIRLLSEVRQKPPV